MKKKAENRSSEKSVLHPRNLHRFPYDFDALCKDMPALARFVFVNQYQNQSIDFANPEAVKMLNKALLHFFYGIDAWDIPLKYLCPPIPGRADYIHYMADLLASCNEGIILSGSTVRVLDIGIGANAVYPIIGSKAYGWYFTGSDIDEKALENVSRIKAHNPLLDRSLECRLQKDRNHIFKDIFYMEDFFDMTICNPPFHASLAQATAGSLRKVRNLGAKNIGKPELNFGGQNAELWCPGGEKAFAIKMIEESAAWASHCFWFSTLIAKSIHLPDIFQRLKYVKATEVKIMEMRQGQKISRIVAWTFLTLQQRLDWARTRWSMY
jgi:23S rRNA (adenine1618-N6)-methyltransferase